MALKIKAVERKIKFNKNDNCRGHHHRQQHVGYNANDAGSDHLLETIHVCKDRNNSSYRNDMEVFFEKSTILIKQS